MISDQSRNFENTELCAAVSALGVMLIFDEK